MKTAWLTYAWKDNEGPTQGDIDFIVQEIEKQGISLRFDRRDLVVGLPLWPEIEKHISDPSLCDAWIYVVTATSLTSKPCREELLYALDRTLDKRKETFPMIGLIVGAMPADLPKVLSVRLCVSTEEKDWAKRVASGVRAEKAPASSLDVTPFVPHLCDLRLSGADHVFEIRPRLGSWAPFCFGLAELDADRFGTATYAPSSGELAPNCWVGHQSGSMKSFLHDWREAGYLWRGIASPAVTPTVSAHLFLRLGGRPLTIHFGQRGGPIYTINLEP